MTGTDQVWGALLASTATNVAIFVPVIFLKDVEGQLFADLSLTIAFAVFVSLIVAVTVVPVASVLFLKTRPKVAELASVWRRITDVVMNLTDTPRKRQLWIGGLIAGSLLGTWLFLPSLQYLPQVKRAAIDGFIQYPTGATVDFADKKSRSRSSPAGALHVGRETAEAAQLLHPNLRPRRDGPRRARAQ
jgi:multidrug efflux pump subunit AcrB